MVRNFLVFLVLVGMVMFTVVVCLWAFKVMVVVRLFVGLRFGFRMGMIMGGLEMTMLVIGFRMCTSKGIWMGILMVPYRVG